MKSVTIKNNEQIEGIRAACKLVAQAHQNVREKLNVGMSTYQVENIVKHTLKKAGAKSAFYKYTGGSKPPFPGHICISVNEEVVHGIAAHHRKLNEWDVVTVDIGAVLDGYYGDAAVTHVVRQKGVIYPSIARPEINLVRDTEQILYEALDMTREGVFLFDVSKHIADTAKEYGYGNVIDYFGHGVGLALHEPPTIPNYVPEPGTLPNIKLQAGMIITYEPMFTLGTGETKELNDNWTVVTKDGSIACHWEHTLLVTKEGAEVLTKL